MSEEWRGVSGYEDLYEVSSLGRVRNKKTGLVRKPRPNGGKVPYLRVSLWRKNKRKETSIHSMVLTAFVGPRPIGYEGSHLDGNNLNNRLENLEWVTKVENEAHKRTHGTALIGDRHWTKRKHIDAALNPQYPSPNPKT